MKRRVLSLVSIFISLVLVISSVNYSFAQAGGGTGYVEGELLLKFKKGVSASKKKNLHNSHGSQKLKRFRSVPIDHVKLKKGMTVEEAIEKYMSNPNVEYAEPNYIMELNQTQNFPDENDFADFYQQWSLHNEGQTGGTIDADIDAPEAWSLTTGSDQVVVAVIDTGVDYTHEDLAANMWVNPGESGLDGSGNDKQTNGIDDDLNGYVDDVHGISAISGTGDPMDTSSHGTNVAGVIGAVGNNTIGIAGINWNVSIMACSAGTGLLSNAAIISCLDYIKSMKDSGVNIIATNNSYGSAGVCSQSMKDVIDAQRDILFIASAGNNYTNNDRIEYCPASTKLPNIIAVTGTDKDDSQLYNYGRRSVHVGAPTGIPSTSPGNMYRNFGGTSAAGPHVTGLAALIKAQDPGRTWIDIKNLILSGGDSVPSLSSRTITGKRINAYGSLNCNNTSNFSAMDIPSMSEVGIETTLSALSINCASPEGSVVSMTSSANETVNLYDDGLNGDLQAGDGIFASIWTPALEADSLLFTFSSGSETVPVSIYATNPWIYDSGANDTAWDIALDSLGNVYVTGEPKTIKYDSSGTIVWIRDIIGNGIAIDNADSVYISNMLDKSTTKYDPTGTVVQWSILHTWMPRDIAVDSNGNVLITGYNNGENIIHTVKYDTNGNMAWPQEMTEAGHEKAASIAVTLDQNNNIYVSGPTWSTADTSMDVLTIIYDTNGNSIAPSPIITDCGSGNSSCNPTDNAVDSSGNIYVSGSYYAGPGPGSDYKVIKYDPAGNEIWSATYNIAWDDVAHGIAVSESGAVYVTGKAEGANSEDFLTLVYSQSGQIVWERAYDSGFLDRPTAGAMITDASGTVYISGRSLINGDYDYATVRYDLYMIAEGDFDPIPRNTPFTYTLAAAGGTMPYSWSIISGSLPPGLSFDTATGGISGTPTLLGNYSFTVQLSDANSIITSKELTLSVYEPPHIVSTALSPGESLCGGYIDYLEAEDGIPPYTWSISAGSLPEGLTLNRFTGKVSGYITGTWGSYSVDVEVADKYSATSTKQISIEVIQRMYDTSFFHKGTVGADYSVSLTAMYGVPPYSWSLSYGSLPPGLTLDNTAKVVSGIPTTAGEYIFHTTIQDAICSLPWYRTITVVDPVNITTTTLPDGVLGSYYSNYIDKTGGATPFTWSVISGSLPGGLSLNSSSGLISGTPDTAGPSAFTVKAEDRNGSTDSKQLSIEVYQPCSDNDSDGYGTAGNPTCPNGAAIDCNDSNAGINPGASDTTCNGIDENCSGVDDEGYIPAPTTCGQGACAGNTGQLECQGGAEVDTCDPFAGAAQDDATCDGIDDDCDGSFDEDYIVTATSCGVGECSASGQLECQGGAEVDTCSAGAPQTEVCNGLDDNCDGIVDDGFDADGDGYATCANDCNDSDPDINPGTTEVCNSIDDDCDATIDEGCVMPTEIWTTSYHASTVGYGYAIAADSSGNTYMTGNQGTTVKFDPSGNVIWSRNFSISGKGIAVDNSGNVYITGMLSAGCLTMKYDADGNEAWTGAVEYADGRYCESIAVDSNGDIYVGGRISNGSNDDFLTIKYDPSGNELWARTYDNSGVNYSWDSTDWVYDIAVDQTGNVYTVGTGNYIGANYARAVIVKYDTSGNIGWTGLYTVTENHPFDINFGFAADLDSSGNIYLAGWTRSIVDSIDKLFIKRINPVDGSVIWTNSYDEIIPGERDQVNGMVITETDGAEGIFVTGWYLTGSSNYNTYLRKFDLNGNLIGNLTYDSGNVDQAYDVAGDGNGNVYVGGTINTGASWDYLLIRYADSINCPDSDGDGYTTCQNDCNDSDPSINPGAADANCDGVDNNCNGSADEEYVITATTCGLGFCAAAGQMECQGGTEVNTCTPGSPTETPEQTCTDGNDNDCDGLTDFLDGDCGPPDCSGYTNKSNCNQDANCKWNKNQGICEYQCSVTETPEVTCNDGLDNDCDGFFDNADSADCSSCTPTGNPDNNCDGVDDDCNGTADDAYVPTATSCGEGVCAATGQLECQGGAEVDTCSPGSPQTEGPEGDQTCSDSLDNDCDGDTDILDSDCVCIPTGNPDDNCDGVDDDCNGTADDAYVPTQTNCGIGECSATGQLECQGGTEVDTCAPGSPQTEGPEGDPTCSDSLDNDCDGLTDTAEDPDCTGGGTVCSDYQSKNECNADPACLWSGGKNNGSCGDAPTCTVTEDPEVSCADGSDNDCDGLTDTADPDCPVTCPDGDSDGYGFPGGDSTCLNGTDEDCNDSDPNVNPGAAEICDDGIDNDCDGLIDTAEDPDCQVPPVCTDYTDQPSCEGAGCNWNNKKGTCR